MKHQELYIFIHTSTVPVATLLIDSNKISNGPESMENKLNKYLNLKAGFALNSTVPVSNTPKKESLLFPWLNISNFVTII